MLATGPLSLQPDRLLSGESSTSASHDIVAVSYEGVKVITVEFSSLHSILKNGSSLYNKYLERNGMIQSKLEMSFTEKKVIGEVVDEACVHELLDINSTLRKLNAVQKRHLESLAEGPIRFQPGDRLWRAGGAVDRAFIIVSGSASFVAKRRNAGSASGSLEEDRGHVEPYSGHEGQIDAKNDAVEYTRAHQVTYEGDALQKDEIEQTNARAMSLERIFNKSGLSSDSQHPVEKLRQGLERRANHVNTTSDGAGHSVDLSYGESQDHDSMDTGNDSNLDYADEIEGSGGGRTTRNSVYRRRSSRARKANKVLGRLYNRRAYTGGLVFSRGHFLGDVSKMVDGLLASDLESDKQDDDSPTYGFGVHVDGADDTILAELTIHEEGGEHITHSSTLTAGNDGCVVLVFPKASLIPFLDQYPGVLLSLLGTQVVV
jgi:CRP-like cAMP-binding protein